MRVEEAAAPPPTRRERYRYVLFRLVRPATLSRGELVRALSRASGPSPGPGFQLTRFNGSHGILRCPRGSEAAGRQLLEQGMTRAGVEVETLSTSGTIAALERRHPALELGNRDR